MHNVPGDLTPLNLDFSPVKKIGVYSPRSRKELLTKYMEKRAKVGTAVCRRVCVLLFIDSMVSQSCVLFCVAVVSKQSAVSRAEDSRERAPSRQRPLRENGAAADCGSRRGDDDNDDNDDDGDAQDGRAGLGRHERVGHRGLIYAVASACDSFLYFFLIIYLQQIENRLP